MVPNLTEACGLGGFTTGNASSSSVRTQTVSPPGAVALGQMLALVWISANGHRSNILFEKAVAHHNPRRARVKTWPQRSSVSLAPRCAQPRERMRRFLEFILHFHTDQRHGSVSFVENSPGWTLISVFTSH